jgi:crotonobetainyl-CoA:carnitine CoA-transferase CaiB-like acyl-CoA transferase
VIRVESPGGDISWRSVPHIGPDGAVSSGQRRPEEIAVGHLKRGRGKRSVVIDYSTPRGRELLYGLLDHADVLVENFKPDALEPLGLDYATLSARNPRLVYCAISGYGLTSSKRDWPSMDLAIQADSGFMARTGFPDGPPTKTGITVGDQVPGIYAALGALAALRRREVTGRGELVDVAMYDVLVSLLWDDPIDWYERQELGERWGNADPRGGPLNVYRASDGWLALVIGSDEHWGRLCRLMGREDLLEEIRNHNDRRVHMPEIDAAIARWTAGGTAGGLAEQLRAVGIPGAEVRSPSVARTDPESVLRPLVHPASPEVPSGFFGPTLPMHLGEYDPVLAPAELLGASTRAVLAEMLGLDVAVLDALAADGVIG